MMVAVSAVFYDASLPGFHNGHLHGIYSHVLSFRWRHREEERGGEREREMDLCVSSY